jgi:hypothetical protein
MYPIVGLFSIANPATLPEKKGSPASPVNRYISMLKEPKVLPRIKPASITTKVCAVIGTGVIGSSILICALKAVIIAKPKDKKRFLARDPFSTQVIAIFLEGNVSMFIS